MRRDHVLQFVLEAAQTPDFQGVTAQAVADALSIWRNDAAVELNKLVAEGKLRRVGKKNVRFFPATEETADIRPEPAVQEEPPQAEEETGQYRAFSGLVGADGSLKYQLRVAMAAVAYPPNGLNMLITGSTGSGKSHFARTIWEYAKETKALCGAHAPIPFVEFNCAEYADNPQLLLSHLFGYKKGAFTGALEDKPGLVEQANGGILFLDEIHGLSSTGQEMFFSLLDTGVFRRVGDNTPRTSRFMLIGAMNPCPCGYYGHPTRPCTCSLTKVSMYLNKISGPLLDRMDLQVEVPPVEYDRMADARPSESSAEIRKRVEAARLVQQRRYAGTGIPCNARLTPALLKKFCVLTPEADRLLAAAYERMGLSGRSYDRLLRVARTIADLAGSEMIGPDHVAEAIQFRNLDRKYWQVSAKEL